MAYTKFVAPTSIDSHQTSPAYMLTFLRWSNRDTANFADSDFLELRDPLIVVSDCLAINVSSSKSSYIHQATMVMAGGDINYSTAVAPGDFVLINLLDDDSYLFGKSKTPQNADSNSLYSRASSFKPINNLHDGFKGVFKIQSVRKILQTEPQSGTKTLHYQIVAGAFTEFNQVIYFNPYLTYENQSQVDKATELLNLNAHTEWSKETKTISNLDKVFEKLVGFLIGTGFSELNNTIQKPEVVKNFNKNFLMPPKISSLLGVRATLSSPVTAASFFNYYIGIEKYTGGAKESVGLNPEHSVSGRFFKSKTPPTGVSPIQAEPFCQVTAWSVLNQYTNSLINELYTTFKLTPENKIMPCVVFRQKPFTSKKFKKENPSVPVTEFLSLPRWKISLDLIKTISLGRDDSARINFVHIVGKTRFVNLQDQIAQQASNQAYKYDENDVKRNGLKPFIAACDFDFPSSDDKRSQSPLWNALVFDWLSNGHLKENGTIVSAGITEPIAVGDNLELENTVYHIESVTHTMQVEATGRKSFDTTIKLSYGVDKREKAGGYDPIYPEMQYTDAESYRKDNYDSGYKTMPGFSDSQDSAGRSNGEEINKTPEKAFSLIPKNIFKKNEN